MERKHVAPDDGWGWMIVLGACIGHLLNGAIARSMGVFYLLLLQRFECGATVAAWLTALPLVLWTGLAPFTTALCTRFSCRSVTISGGLFLAAGLFMTAFVDRLSLCFVTFGIVAGTGLCTVYVPGYIIVGEYFEKRKAIAMALSTIGSGLGAFVFPPVVQALYGHYGHRGCFLILSAIMMNGCVGGALFRPIDVHMRRNRRRRRRQSESSQPASLNGTSRCDDKQMGKESFSKTVSPIYRLNGSKFADRKMVLANNLSKGVAVAQAQQMQELRYSKTDKLSFIDDDNNSVKDRTMPQKNGYAIVPTGSENSTNDFVTNGDAVAIDNGNASSPMTKQKKPMLDLRLLKIPSFLVVCQLGITASAVLAITVSFLPALAVDRGMTRRQGALLLSVLGLGDVIGRIPFGILFDLPLVKNHRSIIYGCFMVAHGVVILSMPLAVSYSVLVMLSAMRGLTSGVFMAQRATILADLIGLENVPSAFGLQLLAMTIGALAARTAGGLAKDYLGEFDSIFYITGVMLVVSASVFVAFGYWRNTRSMQTLDIVTVESTDKDEDIDLSRS